MHGQSEGAISGLVMWAPQHCQSFYNPWQPCSMQCGGDEKIQGIKLEYKTRTRKFWRIFRVGFYSPDEKWHLRNVTSDLFQWPLTGVAQVPLFDIVAFFGFYTLSSGSIHFPQIPVIISPKPNPSHHLRRCAENAISAILFN